MSAGELPPLVTCWAETAIAETTTANRKPVSDCFIVASSKGVASARRRFHLRCASSHNAIASVGQTVVAGLNRCCAIDEGSCTIVNKRLLSFDKLATPHLFNSERDVDRLINVLHDDDAEFCSREKHDPRR
jgi:hypothetical protein